MAAKFPLPKRSCFFSGDCFPFPPDVALASGGENEDDDEVEAAGAVEAVVGAAEACEAAAMAAAAVADSTIMRSILILSPATDSMARRSAIATARCSSAMAARFTYMSKEMPWSKRRKLVFER